jgi:hypothetical protein
MQIINNVLVGVTPRGNAFYAEPSPMGLGITINIGEVVLYDYIPNISAITQDELMQAITKLEDEEYGGEGEQTTTDDNPTESV